MQAVDSEILRNVLVKSQRPTKESPKPVVHRLTLDLALKRYVYGILTIEQALRLIRPSRRWTIAADRTCMYSSKSAGHESGTVQKC